MGLDVYLCSNEDWFADNDKIHLLKGDWVKPWENNKSRFKYRFRVVKLFEKLLRIIEEIKPDIVYIASYDIISLSFIYKKLLKYKDIIYLQEHNNVDQLNNRFKYFFYSRYKNSFKHLVFEDFIKERLLILGVKAELLFVVPHPIPSSFDSGLNKCSKKWMVALSNSNSEIIIDAIINNQKRTRFLDSSGFRVIVKSKKYDYSDDSLTVFKGWIDESDYLNYCNSCSYFLIPFSKDDYSYRVSNVFMEAISNKKRIICSNFPLAEFYSKEYHNLCKIFKDVEEIPNLLQDNNDCYLQDRSRFLRDHSDKRIAEMFDVAFKN